MTSLPWPGRGSRASGFTLLELIIALSMVSLLVLVLHQAFSIGVRVWEGRQEASEDILRQEAALRLLQEDLESIQPYTMQWEKGELRLFAGGPRSLFYVTENGHGASSRAGSGLFFTLLYLQECAQNRQDCLYLSKIPVPSPEYVQEVDRFRSLGETERERFAPGDFLAEESILLQEGLSQARFSYSQQESIPFGGLEEDQTPEDLQQRQEGGLQEEHWVKEELPAQIMISLEREGQQITIHSPVAGSQE